MLNEADRPQAEFNSALQVLNRINFYFAQAEDAAINLDVYTWMHSLATVLRELSTETKNDDELERLEEIRKRCSDAVNNYLGQQNKGRNMGQVSPKIYEELHKFDLELRKLFKASGLMMKMQDAASRALR